MDNCVYCQGPESVANVLVKVCSLKFTDIYVYKNQNLKGRCVVATKDHFEELHELDDLSRKIFFDEVMLVANAIVKCYKPQKINYAIYGDTVRHLHMHVVPKYQNAPDWGQPFCLNPENPTDDAWKEVVNTLKAEILCPF